MALLAVLFGISSPEGSAILENISGKPQAKAFPICQENITIPGVALRLDEIQHSEGRYDNLVEIFFRTGFMPCLKNLKLK